MRFVKVTNAFNAILLIPVVSVVNQNVVNAEISVPVLFATRKCVKFVWKINLAADTVMVVMNSIVKNVTLLLFVRFVKRAFAQTNADLFSFVKVVKRRNVLVANQCYFVGSAIT